MAYSPGYQYDVFLSYAREDNRDRWVDALRSAVADETEEITGRPVSVFQDTSLRAGDDFPAEIADAASNSAVMIAVLSPSYLNSSWCRKELEIFLAAFAKSEPMGRLVPLLKRPIGSESRSELIDRFQQFPFLDETQAPLSPGSDLWRSRIREVARAIEKMLQRVRYGAAEESRGDKTQTSEAPAAPADASLSQSPDTTSTTGADLTAVENTEGRSTEPHSESERLSAQLRPAETLVSAFLENLGFTLDEESKRTMSLAGNLGAQRIPDRRDVSTSLILFALCESGWKGIPDSQTDAAGRTVVDRVRSAGQYQNVLEGYFNKQKPRIIFDEGAPTVTGLTANATSLLREACDLARSDGTRAVRPGHIATAFIRLKNGRALNHFKILGVDLSHITISPPRVALQPDPGDPSLHNPKGPGPSPDATEDATYISEVRTDDPRASSDDLLKVSDEVAAFAQLIASRKTVAPLSIGIFGEWGSGKTFFMERLHDAIDGITSKEAKVDPATFHSSIVQIRFNAWHYIETNLWASLVEFIFRELDGWLRSRQTQEDIEALFEQLATSKQLRLEAARDLIEQRSAKQAAEKLLQTARQDHETAILKRAEAPAADVWAAAKDLFFKSLGAEERRQLEQAAEDLGLSALQKSEAGLAQLLKDSRTQAERTRLVARSLLGRLGTPIWVCAAVLIVLLVPFAAGALKTMLNSAGDKSWLRNVSSSAFGLASLLSTVAVAGRILLGRASKALDSLDQFQEELAKSVSDATRSQQECVTRSEKELADAKLALAEAQRRFAAASDRAIAAEQEYQNDTARGRLNRFIRAKVANGEYAKHLSLVATIRRDFSQLAQIMRDEKLEKSDEEDLAKSRSLYQKKLEELIKEYPDAMTPQEIEDLRREPEQSQLRFFKRIILYIDDLDRCSPEKVADVLQAIHMLLFFPLFVVVVAVDARWVTRSLEIKFPHLLYPEDQEVGATAIADNADSRLAGRPNWVSTGIGRVPPATALDYIEKIFHIPFWVRSMDKDTSADFVAGLAKGFSTADSQPQPDVLLTPGETRPRRPEMIDSEKAKRQELDHSDPAPVMDDQTSQAGVPSVLEKGAAAQRSKIFKTTPLSNDEIAMLRRFAPYIGDTPRSAKRFVNLYHLLRTSLGRTGDIRGADDLVHWLALIGLLSLVTGAPEFAGQFLATLDNEELLGNVHDGVFSRLGTSLAAEPEGQRAALEGILRCLTEESAKGKITDGQMIEVLRRFGSTITRYSFYGHQSKGANKRRSWPTRSFAKGA